MQKSGAVSPKRRGYNKPTQRPNTRVEETDGGEEFGQPQIRFLTQFLADLLVKWAKFCENRPIYKIWPLNFKTLRNTHSGELERCTPQREHRTTRNRHSPTNYHSETTTTGASQEHPRKASE
jgi:hypothetical protein